MNTDVLLLEDDDSYAEAVGQCFSSRRGVSQVNLHRSRDIAGALDICRRHDIRVAIIDLSLSDGTAGTDAIAAIWKFDKKIIFLIHTIHDGAVVSAWSARLGIPYTSQFFLQKSGMGVVHADDAAALFEMTTKAIRSYVPHVPSAVISVREVSETIATFSESHPSFRRAAIVSNIHHSQDALNGVAQKATDRLARTGFDSTRIAVAMTGSFARFEATAFSDADYFVVFDDRDLSPDRLTDLVSVAYHAFVETGNWFEERGVPVHGFKAPERAPDVIAWHTTTLPTWFPLTSLLSAQLGRSTQLEVTKLWFLLESIPLFNPDLFSEIRRELGERMGVLNRPTVRDAIAHSSLVETYLLLHEEFDHSFRQRRRDSLTVVKHYFMRLMNLVSIRLWLIRSYLAPEVFDAEPERFFDHLLPHPLARVIQFYEFLQTGAIVSGDALERCLSYLEAICNSYAEAAHAFGSAALRAEAPVTPDNALINDLADAGQRSHRQCLELLRTLAESRVLRAHPEIASLKLL